MSNQRPTQHPLSPDVTIAHALSCFASPVIPLAHRMLKEADLNLPVILRPSEAQDVALALVAIASEAARIPHQAPVARCYGGPWDGWQVTIPRIVTGRNRPEVRPFLYPAWECTGHYCLVTHPHLPFPTWEWTP